MKTLSIVLAVLLYASLSLYGQNDEPTEYARNIKKPKFFQDVLDFSSGRKNQTRVDVFILLPYSSVQFVKSDNGFTAKYTATISVFDKDKEKLIEEKSWNEKLNVGDFKETTSKEKNSVSLKSFFLPPGEYVIRTDIHDPQSNNDLLLEHKYPVRDLSGIIAVSDVMILGKNIEGKGVKKITPNITGDVMMQEEGLPFFFEIYSAVKGKVKIDFTVKDVKKKQIFEKSIYKDIDSGTTQVFQTLKDSVITLGIHQLNVSVKDSDKLLASSAPRSFVSRLIGVPALITDLDKAVDEMTYIASPGAIDSIKDAPNKEVKLRRFMAYWKRISPTPESEDNAIFNEYYRRVNYANDNFSQYFEGWRSDRGMVFILLGPPDNVDRHPFDLDSKPYEVWSYYELNASLIFVDRSGFGDYRLVTPLTGELYKFRM